ncbi:uncharacterized protein PFL1_00477 [Pseudozyma flocculosa PF-1]|uniref:Related to ICE2 - integral ER membrane protein with type-III transmembrane domains n=1 Tax=Pseudozyma flocculosa TaxID=84751 RepID=A0A5C3EQY5_9BASI|nr:uncharacterized protein PFL1_00477 [Pseudozyma flocculosa PF-1]EPQ32280.1 hypothetical protein PFL1_00477 [Pseudozyma flocculosa PF-1]SPO34764.1 related to ICE2 - integral ER membrane protein with type-III transmembrane domains [Pseudozyma flocculosa]
MSIPSSLAVNFGRVATFIQVLFYLPLALDIAGQDAFLALSASLASYYFFLSTVRLLTRRTRLAWIGQTLAIFQFVVVPACLLVCCNVYSPPSTTIFPPRRSELAGEVRSTGTVIGSIIHSARGKDAMAGFDLDDASTGSAFLDALIRASASAFFYLARHVPGWWHTLLRLSSPLFSLLEGVASLLVIQSLASTSRWIIASSLAAPSTRYQTQGPASAAAATAPPRRRWFSDALLFRSLSSLGFGASEVWQIFFLLISATTYVCAALALYVGFEGATKDRPGTAAAIATSVTSTVWLTVIAFAIRKGNVIETSLMFAYVVFNIYQLGPSLSFTPDPISLIRSFKVNTRGASFVDSLPSSLQAPLPSKILQALGTLLEVLAHWLGQSLDFLSAAGAALPKSVIVSLVYRLMVLYAASRILPMLKGNVAAPSRFEEGGPARRESWGTASGSSKARAGADKDASEGGNAASGAETRGDAWARKQAPNADDDTESVSDSTSGSDSEESGAEVEEYEEEVWDEDEGRWILQKRRRTIRRRRRSRGRHSGKGGFEDEESDGSQVDPWADEEEAYSEDDSGIAYNDEVASLKEADEAIINDPAGVKEPPPDSDGFAGDPAAAAADSGATAPPPPSTAAATAKGRTGRRSRTKSGRRDDLQSRGAAGPSPSASTAGGSKPFAPHLNLDGLRSRKRRRDASGSSTPSSASSSFRRSSKRRHRSSPTSSIYSDDGDDEQEPFGAFISILVSYSRLILIAVYSHLLLLDQKNQIYWRFLTVGLTLTLWGLELVISKEDEVDVGGGGEMLAR